MQPERILAIKLADLGDVLVTEPAIRSLRVAYPEASIDVLTTPAAVPLVRMLDPFLNPVAFDKDAIADGKVRSRILSTGRVVGLGARLRASDYDMVAVFHHLTTARGSLKYRAIALATGADVVGGLDNGRGGFLTHAATDLGFGIRHESEYMLAVAEALGGSNVSAAPRLTPPTSKNPAAFPTVKAPFALVFPTTGPYAPARNWPVESFAQLSVSLLQMGIQPVLAGASEAFTPAQYILRENPEVIDLTGQTSLAELMSLTSASSVVISGDSFPGHLADALNVPVVSIFGPSNHRAWGPYNALDSQQGASTRTLVVRNDVPCAPCLYTGYRLGRRNGCAARSCLTRLSPAIVMDAVRTVIGDQI
jgi:ADP-heptose:LPS heptosyltransferase